MSRFKVTPPPGREGYFEEMWLSRDTHLKEVPGFREFRLLKGSESEGYRLYSS